MLILDVNKVNKNFGYGSLFENLSFSLSDGERISIVGANGCGKSTLLKMIAGIEKIDSGTINIKKDAKIAYLDQTAPDTFDNRLVINVLKDTFCNLIELQRKIDIILDKMQTETDTKEHEKLLNQYGKLTEKFELDGGYDIETKIYTVCSGLNISENMLNQNYNSLSGGEKTLVHLAKALLIKPDLFLLDEPTNHLDIGRIEWLENYIKNFKGAIVTVSHDRYFLDRISNKILEIDNGQATIYNTNYSNYLEEKEINFQKQMTDYKTQQQYFKRMEEQIDYFAQMGMAKNSSTMTKRAASLQSKLDREKAKAIRRPQEQKEIKMGFYELQKSSKRILEVNNLTVFTTDKKIIDNVSTYLQASEKVAIIGDNGSGKSTFIKTILGKQTLPHTGEIIIGPSVKIGYLPQIIDFENSSDELLEYFKNETSLGEQKARAILSRFLFDRSDVNKRVADLSGGEKIRIKLATLLQKQVNTLVFDEPTNHIDIPTKETLEDAMSEFDGTLLLISHDRYFINKFAQRIIEFKDGKITNYIGNYEDYKLVKNNSSKFEK